MANKKLLFGMLVMVLVLSFTVIGCDNGTTSNGNGGSLDGTWSLRAGSGNYNDLIISGSNVTMRYRDGQIIVNEGRGTISYEGSTFTMTLTQVRQNGTWENLPQPMIINGNFSLSETPNTLVMTGGASEASGMFGNPFTRQ